jgi:hypothetical protein
MVGFVVVSSAFGFVQSVALLLPGRRVEMDTLFLGVDSMGFSEYTGWIFCLFVGL